MSLYYFKPNLMKITKILFSLFILAIAVSCGDDDDGGTTLTNQIVWQVLII